MKVIYRWLNAQKNEPKPRKMKKIIISIFVTIMLIGAVSATDGYFSFDTSGFFNKVSDIRNPSGTILNLTSGLKYGGVNVCLSDGSTPFIGNIDMNGNSIINKKTDSSLNLYSYRNSTAFSMKFGTINANNLLQDRVILSALTNYTQLNLINTNPGHRSELVYLNTTGSARAKLDYHGIGDPDDPTHEHFTIYTYGDSGLQGRIDISGGNDESNFTLRKGSGNIVNLDMNNNDIYNIGKIKDNKIYLESSSPQFIFNESDQGIDNKLWTMAPAGRFLYFNVASDDESTTIPYMYVQRVGTSIVRTVIDNGYLQLDNLASTYSGGSAYVCVQDSGRIIASETPCP